MLCIDNRDAALESEKIAFDPKVLNDNFKAINDTFVFQRLVKECDRNYEKDGVVINVSASFGIAVAPDHGVTYEELSQKADEMLLAVKRENKKGYRLYQQISADKEL